MITRVSPQQAPVLAPAIAKIYRWYVENTAISFELTAPSVEEMERRIEEISRRWTYYIYQDDKGSVLGWAYAHPWKEREAYNPTFEDTIYLHPAIQGHGIGSDLLRNVIDDCREMGVHSMIACITASNTTSIEFHRRFGFKEASFFKEVGYKLDAYHDVIDMQLVMPPQNETGG
ncbi:MAG: N-acetyltransferase family protein [Bacteroidales bacterium]|nr:N-acetyltransferase family protein [Bacteroidales bacterium]